MFERNIILAGICALCTVFPSAPVASEVMSETEDNTEINARLDLSYVVINQPIKDVFAAISRDSGVRIRASDAVRGRLSNVSLNGDVYEVVSDIAELQSLDWFEYNGVIHISAEHESATRIVRLGDLYMGDAMDELKSNGLVIGRFPINATSENSALSITGPPYMIALAESIIEGMPSEIRAPRQVAKSTILVRRGREVEYVHFLKK